MSYNTKLITRRVLKPSKSSLPWMVLLDTNLIRDLENLIRFPQTSSLCPLQFDFRDLNGNWMFYVDNKIRSDFIKYLELNYGNTFKTFTKGDWCGQGLDVFFRNIDKNCITTDPEVRLGYKMFEAFCEFAFTDSNVLFGLLNEIKSNYQKFINNHLNTDLNTDHYTEYFWKLFSFDCFLDYPEAIKRIETKANSLLYEEIKEVVFST